MTSIALVFDQSNCRFSFQHLRTLALFISTVADRILRAILCRKVYETRENIHLFVPDSTQVSTEVLPLVSLVTGQEKNGVFINCDVQCAYMDAIHVVEELQTRLPAQSDRLFQFCLVTRSLIGCFEVQVMTWKWRQFETIVTGKW